MPRSVAAEAGLKRFVMPRLITFIHFLVVAATSTIAICQICQFTGDIAAWDMRWQIAAMVVTAAAWQNLAPGIVSGIAILRLNRMLFRRRAHDLTDEETRSLNKPVQKKSYAQGMEELREFEVTEQPEEHRLNTVLFYAHAAIADVGRGRRYTISLWKPSTRSWHRFGVGTVSRIKEGLSLALVICLTLSIDRTGHGTLRPMASGSGYRAENVTGSAGGRTGNNSGILSGAVVYSFLRNSDPQSSKRCNRPGLPEVLPLSLWGLDDRHNATVTIPVLPSSDFAGSYYWYGGNATKVRATGAVGLQMRYSWADRCDGSDRVVKLNRSGVSGEPEASAKLKGICLQSRSGHELQIDITDMRLVKLNYSARPTLCGMMIENLQMTANLPDEVPESEDDRAGGKFIYRVWQNIMHTAESPTLDIGASMLISLGVRLSFDGNKLDTGSPIDHVEIDLLGEVLPKASVAFYVLVLVASATWFSIALGKTILQFRKMMPIGHDFVQMLSIMAGLTDDITGACGGKQLTTAATTTDLSRRVRAMVAFESGQHTLNRFIQKSEARGERAQALENIEKFRLPRHLTVFSLEPGSRMGKVNSQQTFLETQTTNGRTVAIVSGCSTGKRRWKLGVAETSEGQPDAGSVFNLRRLRNGSL